MTVAIIVTVFLLFDYFNNQNVYAFCSACRLGWATRTPTWKRFQTWRPSLTCHAHAWIHTVIRLPSVGVCGDFMVTTCAYPDRDDRLTLPYQAVPYRSFTFQSVPFRLPVPRFCG